MRSASRPRVRSRAWGIVIALLFLAVLGFVITLAPGLLSSLAVPERAPIRDLLGGTVPIDLDFMFPTEHYLKQPDAIPPLAQALLGKEARLVSAGAGPELVPGYAYGFDYGYKGPTIRVFADGRVQVRLDKSEIRNHKGVLGLLWGTFGDRGGGC